jgi:hypothetical protein
MNTKPILDLARKHVATTPEHEGSARLCLADAVALYDAGDWQHARSRALKSLAYSIGILHPDYRRAAKGEI